ncbi:L,D-transpeptidase family protein [Sideroxydans lithotrophicus]|uniref:ErfK/YbiS/YcfS/YnhG family protein n=1 Tax=Sideroxydans lithotrophicus (strain ES-1) TaxID=580332 RepID=D5CNJ8_SIDLE|nr:L,D-transpeptidase family protein [Sideroxydans lithotrophicus]ADE10911.1 ErfK/YbiS/YcfS/YnhG family protein [Sideroxydans lithotrophicus ES-1]
MTARLLALLLLPLLAAPAMAGESVSRELEIGMAKSLRAIGENHLDVALNEVDSLLKINPNFKLAQLVKGDLLLARSKPISSFGDAPNAPPNLVQDLREEANVRLQRAQEQQPIGVPKYLWQLSPQQRYAVVVDTSKSTLYLFENVNGEPRYVSDFYISVGKKGADKVSEGDQKTPLGVYFVNGHLGKDKITDFYGPSAYPLSYPNEWDKREGHDGHGIWLHGTPPDTFSRPPRASNGCVVLANNDLNYLGSHLQIGITPVIIASKIDWVNDEDNKEHAELLKAVEQWRSDWASRDTDAYLSHYAPDFSTGSMKLPAFAQQKRLVNSGKTWIKVKMSNVSMFPYPSQPDLVVVNFEQDYESNNLNNHMNKRQYWMKRNGHWQIVYEGAA